MPGSGKTTRGSVRTVTDTPKATQWTEETLSCRSRHFTPVTPERMGEVTLYLVNTPWSSGRRRYISGMFVAVPVVGSNRQDPGSYVEVTSPDRTSSKGLQGRPGTPSGASDLDRRGVEGGPGRRKSPSERNPSSKR